MTETAWTGQGLDYYGQPDPCASNPGNWTNGTPDSNTPGVFPAASTEFRMKWDLNSLTVEVRYEDFDNFLEHFVLVDIPADLRENRPWFSDSVMKAYVAVYEATVDIKNLPALPPPTPDFDVSGDGVYCPDGNYELIANQQGWEVWATFRQDGNIWVFPQSGTDRYWVDAAEGGASVPGAGENVFFDNHASESGSWNAVTHWKAAVGTAAAGAYTCTMDVDSAALGTLDISYASAILTTSGTNYALTAGATAIAGTLSLNASAVTLGAITISDGGLFANMTATTHATGNLVVGGGASGSLTFADGASSHFHLVGSTTINAGATLGTAATHFELYLNGDLLTSAGTLIAPNVVGHLLFYIGTWNTPTVFTHSSSDITFLGSGTTLIGNNSTQFYDVQIANFTTVSSQTYNFTCQDLDIGGGVSGSFTTSTGVKTINGTLHIGTGANFGTAATNYTLDLNGNMLSSTGTLIAPNASGTFTFSGGTWNTPTTFTTLTDSRVTFDRAGTTTLGNNSIQFNAVTINSGTTVNTGNFTWTQAAHTNGTSNLKISGTFTPGSSAVTVGGNLNRATVVVDGTGVLNAGSGAHSFFHLSIAENANVSFTSATTTITGYFASTANWLIQLPTAFTFAHSNGTLSITISGGVFARTTSVKWTIYTFSIAASKSVGYQAGAGFPLTVANTFTINSGGSFNTNSTNNNALTVTNATSSAGTFTPNTSTITLNGTLTISAGTFGGNTAYTLDLNANLLASAGTLIAPNASGSFTYSGATWLTPTTFTHNNGTVTFDLAGTTTLGNASTQFASITISNGTTFDTDSVSNYDLTVAVDTLVSGVFYLRGSTVSFGTFTTTATAVAMLGTSDITMNDDWNTATYGTCSGSTMVTFAANAGITMKESVTQSLPYMTVDAGVTLTALSNVRIVSVLTINGGMTGAFAVSVGWGGSNATPLVLGVGFSGWGTVTTVSYQLSDTDYDIASCASYPTLWIISSTTSVTDMTGTASGDVTCTQLVVNHSVLGHTVDMDMGGWTITVSGNAYVGNVAGTRVGGITSTAGAIDVGGDFYATRTGCYLSMSATTEFWTAGNATFASGTTLAASTGFLWDCYGTTTYTDNNAVALEWQTITIDAACSLTCATHISTGAQTTINGAFDGGAADNDMNNMTMNAGGTWTATSATTYIFSTITINGGAFTHSNGEINFDDADMLPGMYDWTTDDETFYDVVFNITLGTKIHNIVGTLNIAHDFSLLTAESEMDLQAETMNLGGDFTVIDGVFDYDATAVLNFNGVALQTITVPTGDFYVPNVTVAAGASAITTDRLFVVGVKTGSTSTIGPPVTDRLVVDGAMTIDPLAAFWHAPEFPAGGGEWTWWAT